jgi:hypothetical protein
MAVKNVIGENNNTASSVMSLMMRSTDVNPELSHSRQQLESMVRSGGWLLSARRLDCRISCNKSRLQIGEPHFVGPSISNCFCLILRAALTIQG